MTAMTAFGAFSRKEALETFRTWRIWVVPGILLFMAVTSPVLARVMPQVMKAVASQQPGFILQLPPPTYLDAYGQWVKNLSQLVLWVVIIATGGVVSAEHRSGTAILVLTKPLSRSAFVAARALASAALLVAATVVGAAACYAATLLLFPGAPFAPLAQASGAWLAAALMLTFATVLFSSLIEAQAGAAGMGLALLFVLYLTALWRPLAQYGPGGLLGAPAELLAGQPVALGWPLASAAALSALCVAGAAALYSRREL